MGARAPGLKRLSSQAYPRGIFLESRGKIPREHAWLAGMMPVMQSLKQQMRHVTVTIVACALVAFASAQSTKPGTAQQKGEKGMQLGNFSVSLAVKDLATSRAFYEKLGFHAIMGQGRFLILQNDT